MKVAVESWTYVLAVDRSRPMRERAVFTLQPLTVAERAVCATRSDVRCMALEIVSSHVLSIGNFPNDAPQPWPADNASRIDYLEQLHVDHVYELAREVLRHAYLTSDLPTLRSILYARAHADVGYAMSDGGLYSCASCAKTPTLMVMLGHDGPPTNIYRENLLTGEALERCPVRSVQLAEKTHPQVSAEIARLRNVYGPHYRHGHLPAAGGVSDQPARTMDLFALMDLIDAEATAKVVELHKHTET